MLSYILPFIALIVVVVFIHEYGHYYFAKRFGVGVTDFSIGFGKEMFGWNDKSGTRWKVCVIPLRGSVKFFGDRNVYSQADNEKITKDNQQVGKITSAVYSPRLKQNIALAMVSINNSKIGTVLDVKMNNKIIKATVVEKPFYDPKKKLASS